jgi:hypothetical protein
MNNQRSAAARKLQAAFRRKFVFSNASVKGVKFTPSKMTTQIIQFNQTTNIHDIFDAEPKGFTEIIGYKGSQRMASIRWVSGRGWIGDQSDVTRIAARRKGQTVIITKDLIEIKGSGNYEPAILAIVRNDLADRSLLRATPKFVKFEGRFNINHTLALYEVAEFLSKFGKVKMFELGDKAVVFKTSGITFQIFKNGTIIFGGLKDPKDLDKPRAIFKEFAKDPWFSKIFHDKLTTIPSADANLKKMMLAGRYQLAGLDWSSTLEKPPFGSYIRPGQDGKPRFYPWATVRIVRHGVGNNAGPAQTFYTPLKFQKKDALAVAKAFAAVNQPIPAHTLEVFAKAGVPIQTTEAASSVKKYKGSANRRANSWNATRAGFYIRPGPGKQPYFYEIPKGLAAGRKTVIKAYTDAGRNIPKAVRDLFKIGENVKTDVIALPGHNEGFRPGLKHVVTMGLNKVLRINNRQATRLTKKELIEIARNMNIARVDAKWKPDQIRNAIQSKAGITTRVNKTFNLEINGKKYKLLNNGRVQKTVGETRTQREWATMPLAERTAIARKILPANFHPEYNATANSNKFDTLRAFIAGKKPPSPVRAKTPPSPVRAKTPQSPNNSNLNRYALELEYNLRLAENMGNLTRNGNQALFMKEYNKLPKGARGKPLKANVNRAYAKFVKETKRFRMNEPARVRYTGRITPPNWLPANKVNAYKNLVTNLAFQKPKPSQKALKEAVMAWLKTAAPPGSPRPARNVENVITGIMKHIPAYNPANRKSPVLPKRTPSPKKSPGTKAANAAKRAATKAARVLKFNTKKAYVVPVSENVENLGNAMIAAGLNVKTAHSWDAVVRSGVNAKFKNNWARHVVNRPSP